MNGEKTLPRTVCTEDGAAIFDTRSGQITTLNSTGAFIWKELEKGNEPSAVAALLAQETGANPAVVEQDVMAFLKELNERHLYSC